MVSGRVLISVIINKYDSLIGGQTNAPSNHPARPHVLAWKQNPRPAMETKRRARVEDLHSMHFHTGGLTVNINSRYILRYCLHKIYYLLSALIVSKISISRPFLFFEYQRKK